MGLYFSIVSSFQSKGKNILIMSFIKDDVIRVRWCHSCKMGYNGVFFNDQALICYLVRWKGGHRLNFASH